jgi:hypothetical protein
MREMNPAGSRAREGLSLQHGKLSQVMTGLSDTLETSETYQEEAASAMVSYSILLTCFLCLGLGQLCAIFVS